jgi:acetylornithine aminotransferase
VAKRFDENKFRYAQSHQNDPFGCAIGLEVIKIIEGDELISKCHATGIYFNEQLERLRDKHQDKIREVRGRGLMLAVEFRKGIDGEKISDSLFESGFVIGFKLNTLRFLPPLTIKLTDIDKMIQKLDGLLTM